MAWTTTKQQVIQDLLNERIVVEANAQQAEEWALTRTWMGIINSHVTDEIKQNILNDLIDDKTIYLNAVKTAHQTAVDDIDVTIAQGISLKE